MRAQWDKLAFAPPMHGTADVTLDFVEKLGSVTPDDLNYVKAFSGGSESMEAAIKFTRQYFKQSGHPHKYKFISRYQAYHGATMGAMAASGTGERKTPFEPAPPGFLKVFPPTHYRDLFGDWDEANRFAAQQFEDVIISEDPATVAGIILEPVSTPGVSSRPRTSTSRSSATPATATTSCSSTTKSLPASVARERCLPPTPLG